MQHFRGPHQLRRIPAASRGIQFLDKWGWLAAILLLVGCGGSGTPLQVVPVAGSDAAGQPDAGGPGQLVFSVIMRPQPPEPLPTKGVSWATPAQLLDRLPPLPPLKDPACTGSGFMLAGGDYQDELPHNYVSREGENEQLARYAPDTSGDDTEDAAYAVYRWNMRGYAGPQTMGFMWQEGAEPSTWRNFWVGFGDLARNTWDWYKGPQDNVLTIESFGPYRAASGEMLMIVLLLGSDEAVLAKMEAGAPEQRATGEVEDLPGDAPE